MAPSHIVLRRRLVRHCSSSTEARAVLALIGLAVACSSSSPDKLSYPPNGILPYGKLHPSSASIDSFEARLRSPVLEGLREPRLDPAVRDGDAYRFTLMPSFEPSVSVRIEAKRSGCVMTRRQVRRLPEPPDSSPPGVVIAVPPTHYELTFSDSLEVPASECRPLLAELSALDIREDTTKDIGPDGTSWMFERLEGGHYAAVVLWSPEGRARQAAYVRVGSAMLRAAGYENGAFRRR